MHPIKQCLIKTNSIGINNVFLLDSWREGFTYSSKQYIINNGKLFQKYRRDIIFFVEIAGDIRFHLIT